MLGYDDVFDSRSVSFAKDIREYTNGRGVDMILNSLTGEGFIDASLSILKEEGGIFVEISKRNILTKEEFKLKKPKCEYHIKDLNECKKEEISMMYKELVELMNGTITVHSEVSKGTTFEIKMFDCKKYLEGPCNQALKIRGRK